MTLIRTYMKQIGETASGWICSCRWINEKNSASCGNCGNSRW